MHRINSWLLALACMASAVVVPASAQVSDASLGGRVVDPRGQGVAGARVFTRRDGTKVRRATVADPEGFYLFPPLPPGTWDVEASADGYTIAVVGDVRLAVAQSRRLELELEPADAQEMVTFFDYEPLARTRHDVGIGLDAWELEDLPLRARTVEELATLVPIAGLASATGASIETRLDGGLIKGREKRLETGLETVPVSALDGVALLSHSYGAEFGGTSGTVSLATRTGGAERSGSAFVLYRDEDIEAVTRRSHFGASLGTPLGRQTSKRGSHLFAAAEVVGTDQGVDHQNMLVRGTRHDRGNLFDGRYLARDADGRNRSAAAAFAWQTQISDRVVHDFLFQVEDPAEDDEGIRQLRSDLFVVASAGTGLHDLAFGVESVEHGDGLGTDRWSLYGRDRWQASDRLVLSAGARSEYFDDEPRGGRSADGLSPRLGLVWSLTEDGSHLLRGGVGRFRDLEQGRDLEQLSLGWSWQMGPFLGITLDAVSVDVEDEAGEAVAAAHAAAFGSYEADYDAVAVTVRSRFSDVFQVRASFSWTDPSDHDTGGLGGEERERAVVTGLYRAPADVVVAAVYRSEAVGRAKKGIGKSGLDLRLAKGVHVSGDLSLEFLAEVFDVFEEHDEAGSKAGRMGQLGLRLSF